MTTVIKHDGSRETFDVNKILNSIVKAWNNVGVPDSGWAVSKAIDIQNDLWNNHKEITSREISDMVDEQLMKHHPHVAREFIKMSAIKHHTN